jgi:trimethylamine--corrinoid protein Co-methyltransferase
VVDAQAGHEKTLTGLAAALAGTNLIYGAGMLDSGNTLDHGMMVIDNEIARMIRRFVGGVPISGETLALDEIHAVGPFSDHLSTEFTYAHMRGLSISTLLDRRVRVEWEAHGAQDMRARAVAAAREILAEHRPEPLPDGVARELSAIVARAAARGASASH